MNKDRVGGLFLLLVGLCFFALSLALPIGKFTQPGPGVFPLVLSCLLAIIGLMNLIFSKVDKSTESVKELGDLPKSVTIILATLGFIVFMGTLGYWAASFLYLLGLFSLVSRYKWFTVAFLSALISTGSWYFFGKILGIFLPVGLLNL